MLKRWLRVASQLFKYCCFPDLFQLQYPSYVISVSQSQSVQSVQSVSQSLLGCNADQIYETILLRIGFLDAEQQEAVLTEYKEVENRRLQQQLDSVRG